MSSACAYIGLIKHGNDIYEGNCQPILSFVQNLGTNLKVTQQKLDKLVSAYLDGDIEKEIYLEKKEELTKQKLSLLKQKEDFGQKGKN